MATVFDGVVLSDDLFKQYHAYIDGRKDDYSLDTIKRILKYHRHGFVSNVEQYQRCGISLDVNLEKQLRNNRLSNQSLKELASTRTYYKIILSETCDVFPCVNIKSDREKVDVSITGSFMLSENRQKAKEHIAALCASAKEIYLFDKHINNERERKNIKDILNYILPKDHKVLVKSYEKLSEDVVIFLQRDYPRREFDTLSVLDSDNYHDRYIVVDNELEILLSSGFDHLARNVSDLTYVVRPVTLNRFKIR